LRTCERKKNRETERERREEKRREEKRREEKQDMETRVRNIGKKYGKRKRDESIKKKKHHNSHDSVILGRHWLTTLNVHRDLQFARGFILHNIGDIGTHEKVCSLTYHCLMNFMNGVSIKSTQ